MKDQLNYSAYLNEKDKHLIERFSAHLLNKKQKDWFLHENRKVIYAGQLSNVRYLEQDAFEYIIEGRSIKVLFPLDQTVHFSKERLEFLTGVSVKLEGLPLKEEDSILLLRVLYPALIQEDKLEKGHVMEMPEPTKNGIMLFKEGLKFCFFIVAILFLGQLFDENDPQRYRMATYIAGLCLLAFIAGYYYIKTKKDSWLRPVPIMNFSGKICQVLYIVDNTGDSSSEEVIYITGSRTFKTWERDEDIHPGQEVSIVFKPFTKIGFQRIDKPNVLEVKKADHE